MQLTPHREIHVELNIVRDNGEIEMFNAYRVQHDNSRGPFKVSACFFSLSMPQPGCGNCTAIRELW